jgi:uncharacterized protein (TIGR03435 family)
MPDLLIEGAIRSTLIAAFAGLVLCVMRIKAAAARHAVWAGVMLAMLLTPALIVWGPKAPLPVLRPVAERAAMLVKPEPVRGACAGCGAGGPAQAKGMPHKGSRVSVVAIIYLVGVLVFATRVVIGVSRVRALRRGTVSCAAPVTVGWLRPTVILPPEWRQWPQARLDAVLAHEREHARRRDPLWRFIALVNRALFWFDPLAWWLERKLAGLAEEACDAAVLARGYDARDYSELLLDLARSVQRAGSRVGDLGVAIPGIGLEHRIRQMLGGAWPSRVSRARMAVTAALCVVAAGIFGVGTLVRAQLGSKGHLEFEVASVRPSNPSGGIGGFKTKDGKGGGGLPPSLSHGRFTYSDSLFGMVVRAYAVKGCRPALQGNCAFLTGGPDWVKKDRFDIQAKTPDGAPEYTFIQFFQGKAPEVQLMLQSLLADRFNLRLHHEKKLMPVYALVIAKRGPKLKKSGEVEKRPLPDGTVIESRGLMFHRVVEPNGDHTIHLDARNSSMQAVADDFSSILERPMLDRTGLKGEFDFTLDYAAEGDQPGAELAGPELFTAFQEQAGLKLEATQATVDALVIDHAEKPSEN